MRKCQKQMKTKADVKLDHGETTMGAMEGQRRERERERERESL
jgi:hypothetical protein